MRHPAEKEVALLAGGEVGRIRSFLLDRHVSACPDCQQKLAQYRELRSDVAELDLPNVNWNFLAADMRANIRLGLEAGACIPAVRASKSWNPRFAVALAALVLLVAAGQLLRQAGFPRRLINSSPAASEPGAVLQLTGLGVEIRSGAKSLTLLNHTGNAANQSVSAQGDIEQGYIDGETGSVTINNVYLQ
jgi:hypothetical protein